MTKMTILLSEEQLVEISEQLNSVILNQIDQIKNQTMKHYRYMNKKQTCQYLQVTNNTLDAWIKKVYRKLKFIILVVSIKSLLINGYKAWKNNYDIAIIHL